MLAFDLELLDTVKMKMEGLAFINVNPLATSKLSASKITTQGTLDLHQPTAIPRSRQTRRVYDDNFFDTIQTQSIESFLKTYHQTRNETLVYDYISQVEYGPVSQTFIDVEMTFDIPNQEVIYIPEFWHLLKHCWVRYISSFIFFYLLMHRLFLNFVITRGAFETVSVSELKLDHCGHK